jgi:Fe-S-cluster containining protein
MKANDLLREYKEMSPLKKISKDVLTHGKTIKQSLNEIIRDESKSKRESKQKGGSRHRRYISPVKNYSVAPREKGIVSPKKKNFEEVVLIRPSPESSLRRCRFIDSSNKRCKETLGLYPKFCKLHSLAIDNLFIKESKIKNAGYGLYAGIKGFKRGDIVGEYSMPEIKLKMKQIDARKGVPDPFQPNYSYTFCENAKRGQSEDDVFCYDALDYRTTIMRYANDAHGSKYKNNVYFEPITNRKTGETRVYMMAFKDIPPLNEIYCTYGDSYF